MVVLRIKWDKTVENLAMPDVHSKQMLIIIKMWKIYEK